MSINYQKTKYHKKTDLIINASIDDVMQKVCDRLEVVIPSYTTPRVRLYSLNTEIRSYPLLNVTCDEDICVQDSESAKILSNVKQETSEISELKRKIDDDSGKTEDSKLRIMEVKS